jgi:O-antigen/teichoic acid export membrane protein
LGFNKTLVKFLSIQGKIKESSQDIVVASIIVLSILVPVTVFLFLADKFVLLTIFKIPESNLFQTRQLYFYAVAANGLLLLGSLYSSVIESQRYIYKINILQLIYSFLYWGLIIVVLLLHLDLRHIGLAIFVSSTIWFIMIIVTMKSIWGKFEIHGIRHYFKKSFKKLTNYSFKIYLSSLLSFFEEPLIKILVSNFFGVTYVGYLDIGIRVKSQIIRLVQTLVYPLFQLFSEIRDKIKLKFIIKDIEEKLILLMLPVCMIIITCTGSFIHLWLATNNSAIIWSTIIVTVGALILQFPIMPTIYYLTIYYPGTLILTQVIIIFINIIIIYVGHFFIGYYSIYLSFIVYYITQAVLRLYYQKRFLDCSLFNDKKYLNNFLIALFLLSLSGIFLHFLFSYNKFLNLTISPLVILALTFLLYKYLKLFTSDDIKKYSLNLRT